MKIKKIKKNLLYSQRATSSKNAESACHVIMFAQSDVLRV